MKKLALGLLLCAAPAFSTTYLVTVAGLGGEPDYEQRFVGLANDTDKMLRASGTADRVVDTLKGPDATKAKFEAVGVEPHASTPEELEARLTGDIKKWDAVITKAHIRKK